MFRFWLDWIADKNPIEVSLFAACNGINFLEKKNAELASSQQDH